MSPTLIIYRMTIFIKLTYKSPTHYWTPALMEEPINSPSLNNFTTLNTHPNFLFSLSLPHLSSSSLSQFSPSPIWFFSRLTTTARPLTPTAITTGIQSSVSLLDSPFLLFLLLFGLFLFVLYIILMFRLMF